VSVGKSCLKWERSAVRSGAKTERCPSAIPLTTTSSSYNASAMATDRLAALRVFSFLLFFLQPSRLPSFKVPATTGPGPEQLRIEPHKQPELELRRNPRKRNVGRLLRRGASFRGLAPVQFTVNNSLKTPSLRYRPYRDSLTSSTPALPAFRSSKGSRSMLWAGTAKNLRCSMTMSLRPASLGIKSNVVLKHSRNGRSLAVRRLERIRHVPLAFTPLFRGSSN
jgi:hypothetical protein